MRLTRSREWSPLEQWSAVILIGLLSAGLWQLLHFVVALLVLPAAFTLAWISTASAMATSGLCAVGDVLVDFGTTFIESPGHPACRTLIITACVLFGGAAGSLMKAFTLGYDAS